MDDDLRSVTAIILAAGQGTRMKSSLPKVLHLVAGKPLVIHAIENSQSTITEKPVVVIGHGADQVREAVGDRARFAIQHPQLGTAHAVQAAKEALEGFNGLILVFYADMPLFTKETMQRLVKTQRSNPGVMTMLSVFMDDPHGFGRVARKADGSVQAIVEEAQADAATLAIHELNVGAYCFRSDWLWDALERIKVSPKGEYYLTDTVELAVSENQRVECVVLDDPQEAIGINTRVHLAEAEAILRRRINQRWMLSGVTMIDPSTTYIDQDVVLEPDTIIYPNTYLYGNTHIGTGCRIGPSVYVWDTVVENYCILGPEVAVRNTTVKANQTIQFAMMDDDQNIVDIE
jgi:bifunctional UDP-N-acetylglucosamine pyrophosphorylase/glucosamine-1-phosphate N-acetyltransferase